jgi:hypothetical protein
MLPFGKPIAQGDGGFRCGQFRSGRHQLRLREVFRSKILPNSVFLCEASAALW